MTNTYSTANLKIEVIVAQYGAANKDGYVMTEQEAMQLHDLLTKQETMPLKWPGRYIVSSRIEGDRTSGAVYATFAFL